MNTNVRSNVITLNRGGAARVPLASQVEVVGALPANMLLAEMVLLLMLASGISAVWLFWSATLT